MCSVLCVFSAFERTLLVSFTVSYRTQARHDDDSSSQYENLRTILTANFSSVATFRAREHLLLKFRVHVLGLSHLLRAIHYRKMLLHEDYQILDDAEIAIRVVISRLKSYY